jgi:predicted transcriptional regulator
MLSSGQLRAARALLGISSQDLADLSGVGWATIRRLETADGVPSSRDATLIKLKETLEAEGVEFIGDPIKSPGVRLRATR